MKEKIQFDYSCLMIINNKDDTNSTNTDINVDINIPPIIIDWLLLSPFAKEFKSSISVIKNG